MSGIWRHHALYKFRTRRRASSLSTDKTGRTCCKMRFDAIILQPKYKSTIWGSLWSFHSYVKQIKFNTNWLINKYFFCVFFLSKCYDVIEIFPNLYMYLYVAKIHQIFCKLFFQKFHSLKLYNVVVVVFVI